MGDSHAVEGVKLLQLVRVDYSLKLHDTALAQGNRTTGAFAKFHRLMIQEKSDAVPHIVNCRVTGVETHRLS